MQRWSEAAVTSLGLFWTAFWAFGFGYLVSAMIQVFVTRARMQRAMGETGPRSVLLATFFGFVSSSCSFAALAAARSIFTKGAGLIPSLAFLLASTNLVIELGIVIAVFLGWQFVVGEYAGGVLLILLMWLAVRVTASRRLEERARAHAREKEGGDGEVPDWKRLIRSREGWRRVARRYVMEWQMVWKDVTIGFTVAGIIAAFVPHSFFELLFPGTGDSQAAWWQVGVQALVAPLAAFVTFIGSMGNIPLAAVLFANGVGFAGIMAFIFSDLIVLPVLRIQASYYGWTMALYILAVFLVILVTAALAMHYAFSALGLLPSPDQAASVTDRQYFSIGYTLFLNLFFIVMSAGFAVLGRRGAGGGGGGASGRVLFALAMAAFAWLAIGLAAAAFA